MSEFAKFKQSVSHIKYYKCLNPYFQDEGGYEVSDGGEEGEGEGSGRDTPAKFAPEIIGSNTLLPSVCFKIIAIKIFHLYGT